MAARESVRVGEEAPARENEREQRKGRAGGGARQDEAAAREREETAARQRGGQRGLATPLHPSPPPTLPSPSPPLSSHPTPPFLPPCLPPLPSTLSAFPPSRSAPGRSAENPTLRVRGTATPVSLVRRSHRFPCRCAPTAVAPPRRARGASRAARGRAQPLDSVRGASRRAEARTDARRPHDRAEDAALRAGGPPRPRSRRTRPARPAGAAQRGAPRLRRSPLPSFLPRCPRRTAAIMSQAVYLSLGVIGLAALAGGVTGVGTGCVARSEDGTGGEREARAVQACERRGAGAQEGGLRRHAGGDASASLEAGALGSERRRAARRSRAAPRLPALRAASSSSTRVPRRRRRSRRSSPLPPPVAPSPPGDPLRVAPVAAPSAGGSLPRARRFRARLRAVQPSA